MGELDTVSAWAKLHRAETHAKALQADYGAWCKDKPYELIDERNPEHTRFSKRIRVLKPPRLGTWALMFGDCIHNARCVLDHILYAAVLKERNGAAIPADRIGAFGFPIRDTAGGFASHVARKGLAEYMNSDLITLIESVQPYRRPHPASPPLMALLRDFDNIDKHNSIHLALAAYWNRAVWIDTESAGGQEAIRIETAQALEDGAEVAAFAVASPAPNIKYKFDADVAVGVEHAQGPSGHRHSAIDELAFALAQEAAIVFDVFVAKYGS